MPQESVGYAIGRISVLRRERLDAAKLDRLLAAQQPQEALRALQEIGWANAEQGMDYEAVAGEHVRRACAFVREVSPDPDITDCFLLRYDLQNLKMLLKARCLGEEAAYLSACGALPVELLRHAVAEANYRSLPDVLREALTALEARIAVREDPMDIDVTLDRAMFAMVFSKLVGAKAKVARRYFAAKVDLSNAMTLLRVRAMGRSAAFFASMVLRGGTIDDTANAAQGVWLQAFSRPERLPDMLRPYGKQVTDAAHDALQHVAGLPALERAMDDYLLSLFTPYKHRTDAIETIIGYLLAQEREAAAVRLIMAGKLNGFSAEAIRERLRALYE